MRTLMAILLIWMLAIIGMLMTTPAMALECPIESLQTISDDGLNNVAIMYSCDNGTETRVIKTDTGADAAKLIKMLTGKTCLDIQALGILMCQ